MLKHLKAGGSYEDSDEEDDVAQICMNLSCPQYTGEGKCPLQSPKLRGATKKDADDDLKAIEENDPKVCITIITSQICMNLSFPQYTVGGNCPSKNDPKVGVIIISGCECLLLCVI